MMDPDYDLFVAVVAAGSLSAAGRTLSISPAMVSKRISRLERRLETRLIHRSTRRMMLTAQGERLHADLAIVMASLSEAEERARGDKAVPSGPLRVTAPTSFGRMHVAPHIGRFMETFPQIALSLDLSDDYTDLMQSPYDLAIRISDKAEDSLIAHRLSFNRRVLCASPSYIARHGHPETLESLKMHRLLAAQGQLPWRIVGPNAPAMLDGESYVRTNSSEIVRELALSGLGIALRSLWDVSEALRSGALVRILPEYQGSVESSIWIAHLPSPQISSAVQAFVDFTKTLLRNATSWDVIKSDAG